MSNLKLQKYIIVIAVIVVFLCSCGNENDQKERSTKATVLQVENEDKDAEINDKGYDLPVEESVKEEAVEDCIGAMEQIRDMYRNADKGTALNAVIDKSTMLQMKNVIKTNGCPVIGSDPYSAMDNYQKMERFLTDAKQGKSGEVILYEIYEDDGSFQYLGNRILDDGLNNIPEYQYRLGKKK